MKYFITSIMLIMLILTACAPARQKLSPQANVTLKDANVFYQQKNVDSALKEYQKVLKDNPDYVLALRRVADINLYYAEQNPSKAIEYNKIAFDNYNKAIIITESFANLKDADQIEIRDMKRRKTSAWSRIFNAADGLLAQGNTNDALQGFQIAATLDPDRVEPLIKMKDIYDKELKDSAKAEQILIQLYERKPKEVLLLQEIGAFYFNKPDFRKALEFFQKASLEAPLDTNLQMNISFCYYEMEDYANALKSTEAVLKLEPVNRDALRNARAIAIKLENTVSVIEYTGRILDLEESDEDYLMICRLLNSKEQFADLIVWAEKWYSYDPVSETAARFVVLGAQKTNNKALELKYNKIIEKLQ